MKIKVTKQFIHHPIRSRGSPTGTRAFTNTPELVYHRLNKRLLHMSRIRNAYSLI